jgi:hypothetical protein
MFSGPHSGGIVLSPGALGCRKALRGWSDASPCPELCSARCRIARWRQARAVETAAEVARLQAENAALRQRVAKLERLVGQLKRRLWPTA